MRNGNVRVISAGISWEIPHITRIYLGTHRSYLSAYFCQGSALLYLAQRSVVILAVWMRNGDGLQTDTSQGYLGWNIVRTPTHNAYLFRHSKYLSRMI